MSKTKQVGRRWFLFGSLAQAALPAFSNPGQRRILVVLVDGFAPEYLEKSDMPNLKRICRTGNFKIASGVIPSVTNVNNASLVTGAFPSEHGITTNYYYDRKSGSAVEMESARYVLRPTIFEKAARRGWRTALVTSKDKVRTLCGRGAHVHVSAEAPQRKWIDAVGPQEKMYSPDVNYWTFRAARHVLRSEKVQLLYLSTTDYMMHTYPADDARSLEHLHRLDKLLEGILDDHPSMELYLTADHGMNAKSKALDVSRLLARQRIASEAIPIIRDKHKTHHKNLGGASYVYLKNPAQINDALEVLKGAPAVEEAWRADEAAKTFRLHPDRIGDIFLLAKKEWVFGDLNATEEEVSVRSHGSRHEAAVPIIAWNRKVDWAAHKYNLDLTRLLSLES